MKKFIVLFFVLSAMVVFPDGNAVADKLDDEIRVFQTRPCQTRLEFRHLVVGWYVTCPGCEAIPAESIFPPAIINAAENWAVNGQISFRRLMQLTGEC